MKAVTRMMAPIKRRVMLMIGRGIVRVVNDALKWQEVQVSLLEGEVRDGVERVQQYGFTSHPQVGAEAVVVFLGGNRDHGLVIAVDDRRYRLKNLVAGEVALYDDLGKSVIFKRNGDVHITATRLLVQASVQINGNVEVAGNIHATGTIVDDTGNTNHHTHP
jgi:phage gp45-like